MIEYHRFVRAKLLLLLPLAALALPVSVSAQYCGSLENSFGPFDYTDPESRRKNFRGNKTETRLSVVEDWHFQADVEGLTRRDHVGEIDADSLVNELDYTLRAFPNHHRALNALAKLERLVGRLPQSPRYTWSRSAECFFDRAVRFRPRDATVYLLRGMHLHLFGRYDEALKSYQQSEALFADSPDLQYNMGLLFVDLGQHDVAKQYAERAYRLGHRQPGLRDKLARAGFWP